MELPIYQVDAFTSRLFGGNPAAVVPLEGEWLPDATMQNIAAENNLAETSFITRNGDRWNLRWFTPTVEMDLCGHATLAAADVIFRHLHPAQEKAVFDTRSGELIVTREADGMLALDFPARPPEPSAVDSRLKDALGGHPGQVLASQRDYMVVYPNEGEVAALQPDMRELLHVDRFAVIVTAPGDKDVDFVSRFFAPKGGVDEDPVTGSAHCTLIPYWAKRLGKTKLRARQISPRGGELTCELRGDRVLIAGHCVEYLRGTITV